MVLPKTLNSAYDKELPPLGRRLQGELRQCRDCGVDIYVRRYRLNPKGNMCQVCTRHHLRDYARLPRKKINNKLINQRAKPVAFQSVIDKNVNTVLTDQEQAHRCIQCQSLKSRAGLFRCDRQKCKYN